MTRLRNVSRALECHKRAAGQLGGASRPIERLASIQSTVDEERGTGQPAHELCGFFLRRGRDLPFVGREHRLDRTLHCPLDAVFPLFRGMGFRQ
jgi:hypothetical protein